MSSPPLIEAAGLGMVRGERVLFTGLSLSVSAGEACVLRGPNGSGKTTLLRILAGLTRPEAGTLTRRSDVHWVGHREGLKPHETPRMHLRLWAKAWGSSEDIDLILSEMDLLRAADVAARHLSAGQRRRTALARLRLQERPVWLLDEPFTALDSAGRTRVLAQIEAQRARGGAVIAALHGDAGFPSTREVTL